MRTLAEVNTEIATLKAAIAAHNRLQNEGGEGYTPHLQDLQALQAEATEMAWAAEWTAETTAARRAEWNAAVKAAGKAANARKIGERLGYHMSDLAAAIKHHGQ